MRLQRGLRQLQNNESGVVMPMVALMLVALLGFVGLAIDASRAYSVKMRLQESLDAAALVGARNFTAQGRGQQIRAYFNANWQARFMGTSTPVLHITPDNQDQEILITATVSMPTIFMKFVSGRRNINVGALSRTIRGENFLEIAMALDNTSSMALDVNGQPATAPNRRIDIMKAAATQFVRDLYTDGSGLQNTIPNMWFSLVPFTSVVNIGPKNSSILVPNAAQEVGMSNLSNGWSIYYSPEVTTFKDWRGCVFERSFYNGNANYPGRDVTDDPPSVEAFYPYHVKQARYELFTVCNCPTTVTSTPPSTPAPCFRDGVPCSLLNNSMKAVKPLAISFRTGAQTQDPALIQAQATCTSGQTPDFNWFRNNTLAYQPNSNIRPIRTVGGTWLGTWDIPTSDGSTSKSFHSWLTPYDQNTLVNICGASAVHVVDGGLDTTLNANGTPRRFSYHAITPLYDLTSRGRWIAAYPNNANAVLGGWYNSGCGLPLVPLTPARSDIETLINKMDVPPADTNPGSTGRDQGYSGTLINQGMVWAWRTISPLWRGVWRDNSGSPIDHTLPRDYGDPKNNKAVVILSDGLNFLPDPAVASGGMWAFRSGNIYRSPLVPGYYTGVYAGCSEDMSDPNWYKCANNVQVYSDSSAYGLLMSNQQSLNRLNACNNRTNLGPAGNERVNCRFYECMLKVNGQCVRSGGGYNNLTDATVGPYYDELERRLLQTCTNMKAQNVRIYFILFAVNNNPQKARALASFASCVGPNGAVYDAANAGALTQAFQDIAARVRKLQIVE